MNILIISPLYPPDIAPLAVYVKELAKRLSATCTVTVLAYTHIPEQIPNVRIIAIGKESPLLVRLFYFLSASIRAIHRADIVFVQNGPSVELPLFIASFFSRTKCIIRIGDSVGYNTTQRRAHTRFIHNMVLSRAQHIVCDPNISISYKNTSRITTLETPLLRPEILPFAPYPADALDTYTKSWETHQTALLKIFNHATRS